MRRTLKTMLTIIVCAIIITYSLASAQVVVKTFNASSPSAHLDYLKQWVGKYPSAKVAGGGMLNDRNVHSMLLKAVGHRRLVKLMDWSSNGVETEVVEKGDSLSLSVCKAHSCNTDYAHIKVDLRTHSITVRWSESR